MTANPDYLELFRQQHERVKFYAQDFWESAKFFSGLLTVLLSLPVAVWLSEFRPQGWAIVAALAPAVGCCVAAASIIVLQRTASGYYHAAASLLVTEKELGLQQLRRGDDVINLVTLDRIEMSSLTVDGLSDTLMSRLSMFSGWSRMAVILKLFYVFALVALIELAGLVAYGYFGVNSIRLLMR